MLSITDIDASTYDDLTITSMKSGISSRSARSDTRVLFMFATATVNTFCAWGGMFGGELGC